MVDTVSAIIHDPSKMAAVMTNDPLVLILVVAMARHRHRHKDKGQHHKD
jgi:hypothetical protein